MNSSEGKNKLINFLIQQWSQSLLLKEYKEAYIGFESSCTSVRRGGFVDELACNHVEADARVVLHAYHAAISHKTVVIRSPDSDVALITLANLSFFSSRHHHI